MGVSMSQLLLLLPLLLLLFLAPCWKSALLGDAGCWGPEQLLLLLPRLLRLPRGEDVGEDLLGERECCMFCLINCRQTAFVGAREGGEGVWQRVEGIQEFVEKERKRQRFAARNCLTNQHWVPQHIATGVLVGKTGCCSSSSILLLLANFLKKSSPGPQSGRQSPKSFVCAAGKPLPHTHSPHASPRLPAASAVPCAASAAGAGPCFLGGAAPCALAPA